MKNIRIALAIVIAMFAFGIHPVHAQTSKASIAEEQAVFKAKVTKQRDDIKTEVADFREHVKTADEVRRNRMKALEE